MLKEIKKYRNMEKDIGTDREKEKHIWRKGLTKIEMMKEIIIKINIKREERMGERHAYWRREKYNEREREDEIEEKGERGREGT